MKAIEWRNDRAFHFSFIYPDAITYVDSTQDKNIGSISEICGNSGVGFSQIFGVGFLADLRGSFSR